MSVHRTGADSIPEHAAIVRVLRDSDSDSTQAACAPPLMRVRDALITEVEGGPNRRTLRSSTALAEGVYGQLMALRPPS